MAVRYTRQQLLDLYSPEIKLQAKVNKIKGVWLTTPIIPYLSTQHTMEFHPTNKTTTVKADIQNTEVKPVQPQPVVQPKKKVAIPTIPWFYLDPRDEVHGPFTSEQMKMWWSNKQFPENLRISTQKDPETFRVISAVFPDSKTAFTYNPELFNFLGQEEITPETKLDPLEEIFIQFKTKLSL